MSKARPAGQIVMRRARQLCYAGSGLLAAAVVTESFAQEWGLLAAYAVMASAGLIAFVGLVLELLENSVFPEHSDE